ncbi:MAG: prenyltransferase/squalene oxidase repeat-containing protein [Phycisphaerae bacterium]|nr:prenyltransferase/squalene oxidase repeat-containing protein [Tepidisphaeraceae bacterium]
MPTTPTTSRPDRPVVDDAVFDKRALAVGLALALLILLGTVVWKLKARDDGVRKAAAVPFEFSIAEPPVEDFKLRDVQRDLPEEKQDKSSLVPEMAPEKPDVHIAVNPSATPVETEVVQAAPSAQSPDMKIDLKSLDLATKPDTSLDDAPEQISAATDVVGYQIPTISVATESAADIFKYDKPTPRDKPALYTMNVGPRPGRPVQAVLKAFGDQSAPSFGERGPVNINLFGTGDFLRTMNRGAGGVKARSAVDSALHWLAVHQGPDGLWHADQLEGEKPGTLAVTGLSSLAFMGGGHTTRKGEYARNVQKGIEAILRHQKPDGRFQIAGENLYTHAICTIAVAEAYGRARDERLGAAAQKAIAFCEKAVNADGGWRYAPKTDISDLSVTAWFVQCIKTAKLAQLKTDPAVFNQALAYLDSVTDKGASRESNGVCTYTFSPDQDYPSNAHPSLTCAGMMIRQFSGVGVKNHLLVKAADLTRRRPPRWEEKDFYYWYYATYAMHNMGEGHRIWWNQRIRDVLLEKQSRDGDSAGSWDPRGDRWAGAGGRTYTTALGALCLEVYYRYGEALNTFGVAPDLDELFFERD